MVRSNVSNNVISINAISQIKHLIMQLEDVQKLFTFWKTGTNSRNDSKQQLNITTTTSLNGFYLNMVKMNVIMFLFKYVFNITTMKHFYSFFTLVQIPMREIKMKELPSMQQVKLEIFLL